MARRSDYIDKLDKIIGGRIFETRIQRGLSREELAKEIKVTHQQLHKYEKGINRISAGRLAMISNALNKPIDYFFQDHNILQEDHKCKDVHISVNENTNTAQFSAINKHQRMCLEVSRNFMKLRNADHLQAVNTLIRFLIKESA